MKKEFDLEFCYKGNRQYVHGTDIFTKLISQAGADIKNIDIAFHGISVNNISFLSHKPENDKIKVTFKYQTDESTIRLFGIENNQQVNCNYEYLEEEVIKRSSVNLSLETIVLDNPKKYSFIEHIVAMNKELLQNLYTDISGKWYFTRLQLDENINNIESSIQITLKSNFQFKLTKSEIKVDNHVVGFIYFSLINEVS